MKLPEPLLHGHTQIYPQKHSHLHSLNHLRARMTGGLPKRPYRCVPGLKCLPRGDKVVDFPRLPWRLCANASLSPRNRSFLQDSGGGEATKKSQRPFLSNDLRAQQDVCVSGTVSFVVDHSPGEDTALQSMCHIHQLQKDSHAGGRGHSLRGGWRDGGGRSKVWLLLGIPMNWGFSASPLTLTDILLMLLLLASFFLFHFVLLGAPQCSTTLLQSSTLAKKHILQGCVFILTISLSAKQP